MRDRVCRDGGCIAQSELAHEAGAMLLDGLVAERQVCGDFTRAPPGSDQANDLAFTTGELCVYRLESTLGVEEFPVVANDAPSNGGAEEPLAGRDAQDRIEQVVAMVTLQDVALSAGLQRCLYEAIFPVEAQHQDVRLGRLRPQSCDQLRPFERQRWKVDDDDGGPQARGASRRLQ